MDLSESHYVLALCHYFEGHLQRTRKYIEKAIKIDGHRLAVELDNKAKHLAGLLARG